MERYRVTGMSCAACQAHVEKAVRAVPGVASCAVSLLTNSMQVEGTAPAGDIVKAVKDAGYGAAPQGGAAAESDAPEEDAYCPDIMVQIQAAISALNAFNRELLAAHIRGCVADEIRKGNDAVIDELARLTEKLMK